MLRLRLLPTLLLLSACQGPILLPPMPSPSPSPSTAPTPIATPTPEPTPPLPSVPPPGACNPNSEGLRFTVYSNREDRFYGHYTGTDFDKRQPVPFARVRVGNQSALTDAQGVAIVARPEPQLQAPVADQPVQRAYPVTVEAEGHVATDRLFWNDSLCAHNYVALSPLSPQEKLGIPITGAKHNFRGDLTMFHRSESTGLYYLLLRTISDFNRIAPALEGQFGSDATAQRQALAKVLADGNAIVLLSNGSQGLGDTYELVHRATLKDNTQAILATHLGGILADPPNSPPLAGDRFETLIEAVEVPGQVEMLRFETLPYRLEQQQKTVLEVPAAEALLPPVPESSAMSGVNCPVVGRQHGQYVQVQQVQILCSVIETTPTPLQGRVQTVYNQPLAQAVVTLQRSDTTQVWTTQSNAEGLFTFDAELLHGQNYQLTVSKMGYQAVTQTLKYEFVSTHAPASGQLPLPLAITLVATNP